MYKLMTNENIAYIILAIFFISMFLIISYVMYLKIEGFTQAGQEDAVIYVFVSDTCPACHLYNHHMHDKVEKYANDKKIPYKRINTKTDSKMFEKYNVTQIPTCLIIKTNKNGEEKVERLIGAISPEKIEQLINKQ